MSGQGLRGDVNCGRKEPDLAAVIPHLALDHHLRHGLVPVLDGQLQNIPPVDVLQRDIGPVLQQQGGDPSVTIFGRQMERRGLLHVHRVDRTVVLEQDHAQHGRSGRRGSSACS
mgnify:CR=1 FL=1